MNRLTLYTVIYVLLFVLATAQVAIELGFIERFYWPALWAIVALSAVKAVVVAGYYQHLRWEPRSITGVMLIGLLAALALTAAAAYSIT
ncbi:cytochrome C oxidase subunit IV family protein [Natronomonas sp. EA1]|uniref:cytochrome C oxidase subunit IV family protein n=1 Tax=Natronomonas sp. EA1 TaxID=3421655 RepID=UPI003EBDFC5C